MKFNKCIILFLISTLLFASGCTSQKGLELVTPDFEQLVTELRPTLHWQAVPGSNVTYDIFVRVKAKDKRVESDYYRKGLTGTTHKIEIELKPETMYQWSVRSNTDGKVSDWSKRQVTAFVGVGFSQQSRYMRFLTPAVK